MTRKFSELQAAMPLPSRQLAAARADAMLLQMQLHALRPDSAHMLAESDQILPSLENCGGDYLATLRQYVAALGGELKLIASFPDVDIQVRATILPT
jgi:hypothetical protein